MWSILPSSRPISFLVLDRFAAFDQTARSLRRRHAVSVCVRSQLPPRLRFRFASAPPPPPPPRIDFRPASFASSLLILAPTHPRTQKKHAYTHARIRGARSHTHALARSHTHALAHTPSGGQGWAGPTRGVAPGEGRGLHVAHRDLACRPPQNTACTSRGRGGGISVTPGFARGGGDGRPDRRFRAAYSERMQSFFSNRLYP